MKMTRMKNRHMLGYRILFVLFIPSAYLLANRLLPTRAPSTYAEEGLRSRKLLQVQEPNQTIAQAESKLVTNCTPPSLNEFPPDGFTRHQRQSGFIIIHIVIAIYLFLLLAIVCDDFFVPSIKKLGEKMHLTKDVAGATLMAAATSSPELFINIVGTFITQGDLGVGTIVGSAVFNILAVPACCGVFATQVLKLDWWPISRDCLAYGLTVILLIVTLRDGRIEWYEALILVISYILYILAMCFNRRISSFMNVTMARKNKYRKIDEQSALLGTGKPNDCGSAIDIEVFNLSSEDESDEIVNMTDWPDSHWHKLWWVFTWPINLVLLVTIPDCRRPSLKSWYPVTFVMCIVWIATMSYIVAWDITIIGDTFMIPDSVMGLTFLAAGMSVPEAVSSVIVTNQGHGTMGISNSIGSNVFDVLLCLGLPWLVKSIFMPKIPGEYFVQINSEGIVYSSVSLLTTLLLLYTAFYVSKFRLNRAVGVTCLTLYAVFLVFASLIELNVFFPVNLPTCAH